MPRHKKKKRAAAAAAATAGGAKRTDWLVGDLVVAKLRGHRPWPAQIQKPEDYGYDARPHRIFVTFFGTEETSFCSYNKITPFTNAVRKGLAEQLQKINTNPELERAIKEIFAADDELKMSMKSHGTQLKEDDDIASEKSENEEPPLERSRKRARVVEEVAADVVVDDRPAKQEKTVKNMAVEQVQKLPRKVRIKVSTQGSEQAGGGALPVSEKASVSSSDARNSDLSPPRTGESAAFVKTLDKNGERPTADKVGHDSSVTLNESGDNAVGKVTDTVRLASENGEDAEKMEVDERAIIKEAVSPKTASDGVKKMEVDECSITEELVASKPADDGVKKMDVDDPKSIVSETNGPANAKEGECLALGVEGSIKSDEPIAKVDDSRPGSTDQQQQCESKTAEVKQVPAVDDLERSQEEKEQLSQLTREDEVVPSKHQDTQGVSGPELDGESGIEQERQDLVASKKQGPADEPKDCTAKDPVSPSTVSASKEDDGTKPQDCVQKELVSMPSKDEEAVSRSEVHDSTAQQQASVPVTHDETVPASVKEVTVSTTQDEIVPTSVTEQVSVSTAKDETVPKSVQECVSASTTQDETVPASASEVARVSTTQDDTAVAASVAEPVSVSTTQDKTVPTSVNEQVSPCSTKGETLPASVKELVPESTAQDVTVPTLVKEQVSASIPEGEQVARSDTEPSQLEQQDGALNQKGQDGADTPQIETEKSKVAISTTQEASDGEAFSRSKEQSEVAS